VHVIGERASVLLEQRLVEIDAAAASVQSHDAGRPVEAA